ncbi:MAG: RNA polymerase sigma factor [Fimbriimonadaceae bacterium]
MDPIARRAASGDREAMAEIVREHYALVYRFCARRIGPDTAQDAAQETFVTAHKTIRKFDGRSSLSTWLLGIAHNHCRNLSRKRGSEMTWLGEDEMNAACTGDIEKTLIDRELLRVALRGLSPEHREVVLLHEVEGLSYDEAASVIGVPAGTIKSRLHYAFLQLRKALGGCEEVPA